MNPRTLVERAERLTGLGLGSLAAELGLKEATLYKAKLGHIPLSASARKGLERLVSQASQAVPAADATASALRSVRRKAPADPLAEQLAYLRAHAEPGELALVADLVAALHRRVRERAGRKRR